MIVFYCKDCRKIVDAKRKGDKYEYVCPVCNGERVCFGTDKAIADFFQVVVKQRLAEADASVATTTI